MKKIFLTLFLFLSIFCVLVSCKNDADDGLYASAMVNVDMHIRNGDAKEALRALKSSEKYATTSSAKIGLFRRYLSIGEKKRAEKLLKKGIKKLPESLELSAVYGHYLIVEKRLDDAIQVASVLGGTKYGSIYSEAVMKKIQETAKDSGNAAERKNAYFSKSYALAYYDAYVATGNPGWLKNAALSYLAYGEYSKAAALQPDAMTGKDPLFWGLVQYDAGNFDIALVDLSKLSEVDVQSSSLASDAFVMLDDNDNAQKQREQVLLHAVDIPPGLAVNSALWAYKNEEYKMAYDLLLRVIYSEKAFVPALLAYGKLAVEDSKPVPMSDLELTLRQTSLRTNKMKEFDERPRFLVSDAIYRIEEALKTSEKSEDLIVERIALMLHQKEKDPMKSKMALLWDELEHNTLGKNLYPSKLVQYVVQKFISYNEIEEARTLFSNYISSKYLLPLSFEKDAKDEIPAVETDIFGGERRVSVSKITNAMKTAFGDKVAQAAKGMTIWELEYAAYFSLLDGNAKAAQQLYEFVMAEGGDFNSVATQTSISSVINLAMIYSSTGEKAKALGLYGMAAGKSRKASLKSKILARMANIQIGLGDTQKALQSLDYAIALDPSNADARLLKRQIDTESLKKPRK